MIELWRPVHGFELSYEVSTHGNVRSITRKVLYADGRVRRYRGKYLTLRRSSPCGHPMAILKDGANGAQRRFVYDLIKEAFKVDSL